MDYVKPQDIAGSMVAAGASKVNLPIKHLLIRGALAGAYLAVATSMAVGAALQTGQPIVGALVFPFGLCLVILLGTELITGSCAVALRDRGRKAGSRHGPRVAKLGLGVSRKSTRKRGLWGAPCDCLNDGRRG